MKFTKKLKLKLVISLFIGLLFAFIPLVLSSLDGSEAVPLSKFDLQAEITPEGDLKMQETYRFGKCDYHTQIRTIYTNGTNYSAKNVEIADNMEITITDGEYSYSRKQGDMTHQVVGRFFIAFENERDEIGNIINKDTYVVNISDRYDGFNSNIEVTVKYTLLNAVEIFNDYASLNYKLIKDDAVDMKNVTATLKYPTTVKDKKFVNYMDDDTLSQDKIYFSGYGSNSSFDLDNTKDGILKINCKKLRHNEEIEVHTFFSSSLMTKSDKENNLPRNGEEYIKEIIQIGKKTNEEAYAAYQREKIIKIIVSILFISLSLVSFIIHIMLWRKVYFKYDKEYETLFKDKYYRELVNDYPPAMMGYLYHEEEISKDDLSATLLNLIYKGYIEIDTNGQNQTDKNPNYKYIFHREKDTSSLMPHEVELLRWYFDDISKGKDELTLDEIDESLKVEKNAIAYTRHNQTWNRVALNDAKKFRFYEKSAENGAKKYTSIFALVIVIYIIYLLGLFNHYIPSLFSIICYFVFTLGLMFLFYVSQVKRRTKEAQEDYVKWEGFENFLRDFSRLEEYSVTSLAIWDHYLVYATSLGIADLVESQLRTKYSNQINDSNNEYIPLWYYGYHSYYHHRIMRTYTISSGTIAKAQAARSSHSRGGGGSFGGGSSFGGGGSHSSFR